MDEAPLLYSRSFLIYVHYPQTQYISRLPQPFAYTPFAIDTNQNESLLYMGVSVIQSHDESRLQNSKTNHLYQLRRKKCSGGRRS